MYDITNEQLWVSYRCLMRERDEEPHMPRFRSSMVQQSIQDERKASWHVHSRDNGPAADERKKVELRVEWKLRRLQLIRST